MHWKTLAITDSRYYGIADTSCGPQQTFYYSTLVTWTILLWTQCESEWLWLVLCTHVHSKPQLELSWKKLDMDNKKQWYIDVTFDNLKLRCFHCILLLCTLVITDRYRWFAIGHHLDRHWKTRAQQHTNLTQTHFTNIDKTLVMISSSKMHQQMRN